MKEFNILSCGKISLEIAKERIEKECIPLSAYQDLISFYEAKLKSISPHLMAHGHNWTSEDIKRGEELRSKILLPK